MTQYWFKPRTHGYGATPANWKGCATVAAYIAAVVGLSLPLAAWPADLPPGPAAWQVVTWFLLTALLTLAFIRLARAKTSGQWRWRWGKVASLRSNRVG
jgi:hypothetical protein